MRMPRTLGRYACAWLLVAALVILVGRTLAYALNPSPLAEMLEHKAGGPGVPIITLVSIALGITASAAICWVVAFGVRERAFLEQRVLASPLPRFRPSRILGAWILLWGFTCLAGGMLEAYIHWRAGLGWHGLHCLVGPVHRDLIPIFGTLSFVGATIFEAVEHVVAWMRRTFALLGRSRVRVPLLAVVAAPSSMWVPGARARVTAGGPRAPPRIS